MEPATLEGSAPREVEQHRKQGPLTDYGHGDFYYVDLDLTALGDSGHVPATAGIGRSRAVVLDMRGYPNRSSHEVAKLVRQRTVTRDFGRPWAVVQVASGGFDRDPAGRG